MIRSFFVLLLLCIYSSVAFADGQGQSSQQSIEMKNKRNNGHSRGDDELPLVFYTSQDNSFSIEFDSDGSFELNVYDISGVNWYYSSINTDGIPHMYYLNLVSNNTYIITISSSNDSFYGILEL